MKQLREETYCCRQPTQWRYSVPSRLSLMDTSLVPRKSRSLRVSRNSSFSCLGLHLTHCPPQRQAHDHPDNLHLDTTLLHLDTTLLRYYHKHKDGLDPHSLSLPTKKHSTPKKRPHKLPSFLTTALMVLSLSSLTHAQLSLGCFAFGLQIDTNLSPQLPVLQGLSPPYRDIYMSQGSCVNYCKTSQYQYAITEDGTSCFCSHEPPPETNRVEDTRCNKPCAGYPFEKCGSQTIHASDVVGSGAYANVMLVGNSLGQPSTTIQGKDASQTSEISEMVKPEVRKDHEQDNSEHILREPEEDNEDEGEGEDEEGEDDSNGDDDENDGDDDEDDGDDDEDDGEEDDQGVEGGSGKSIHGVSIDTKSPPRGIPVASTAVAVVCLLGIISFLVYLGRKRKRERVRAVWVDSVFGTTGGSDNNDDRTNSRSSFQWQHGDQGFSYDGQSAVIDRRMSSMGPMRGREDSFSRSVRSSVLKPAPALSSMIASSSNYNQMTFSHRLQPVSSMHEHYAEFFDDDDCEDAELTYPDECISASPTSTSIEPPMLQRPTSALLATGASTSHLGHRYPAHPFSFQRHPHQQSQRRQDSYDSSVDPFQDQPPTRSNPYPQEGEHVHQHPQHPHQHITQTLQRHSQPEFSQRQPTSNNRRPHNFTGKGHDEDARYTHVPTESDTESLCSTPAHENDAKSVMQHFKTISIPYAQAIRQQQIELSEGNNGGVDPNIFERSLPAPGPAPTGRRWSRVLKSVGREFGQRIGTTERQDSGSNDDDGHRAQGGRPSHQQVHSGSLASFRGLNDPSHPRLRVTNPDGES